MKKLLSILILSVITLACTFGLVACECKHEFTNYVSDNNATYEADGTKTAVCDKGCGTTNTIADIGTKLESKVIYDFEIVDGVANITVANDVEEYDFNTVITSVGLKDYIVGLDKYGTQTSLTKMVDLSVGDNTFYISETLNGQIIKTIKVIVHRNYLYDVTFEGITETKIVEEGSLATIPEMEPTKAGYTFNGWDFDFNTKITENTNISAIWTANNNTQYKIEYYYENIENNGYTKVESETEEKQGTTDTVVSVTPKTVEHFTLNSNLSTLSGNLNGNGSLVLKVYYKRNVYTVTFNTNGGNRTGGGALTQTIKYGASATAPTLIKPGYTLDGFDKEFNNVSTNLTVTAKWKINQYTLTIVYNNGTANKVITQDYNSDIIETLPNELERVGYTFKGWDKAIPSKMPAQNITITARWSAIFTLSGNTITGLTEYGKTLTEIEIPESIDGVEINAIGNSAFSGRDSLTSITIPNSVTSIGRSAFAWCDSLTSVNYTGSIDNWAETGLAHSFYTFYDLYINDVLVTDVKLTTATKISGYAFYYCNSLISVTIPNSVTSIGEDAFYYCSKLTSITIGDSVTSISYNAFYWCDSLTSIYFNGDVNKWVEIESLSSIMSSSRTLYINNQKPTEIVLDTATKITDYAFWYCDSLTSVTIGDSVTSIGDRAFYDCDSLTSIVIPDSVTSIGNRAFYSCDSLTSITIPNSVTSIGDFAFEDCDSLTIYCKATSKPSGWSSDWNYFYIPVVWGYKG